MRRTLVLVTLLGCGIEGERDQPNPPPQPPERFAKPVDATRHLEGIVSDTTFATRSFSFVADGKRYVAVLTPSANVLVDGRAAGLEAIPSGSVARLDAQVHDDVLMVQRVTIGTEPVPEAPPVPAVVAPPIETAPAAVEPTPVPETP